MLLRREIAERTDHMVAHCGLGSASIFLTERSAGAANLIHLHHVGITEEVKHAYSDAGVFQDDPFVSAMQSGTCDFTDNWFSWDDNRLASYKGAAPRYRGFIEQYSVNVVAAYVKHLTPNLFLLIGTHTGRGHKKKASQSQADLRREVDAVANLVMMQLFEETLRYPEAVSALCKTIANHDMSGCAISRPVANDMNFMLSPREDQIAKLVCAGKQNKEIAFETGLSEYTVENHLRRIYGKVGVHNRAALVAAMLRTSHSMFDAASC